MSVDSKLDSVEREFRTALASWLEGADPDARFTAADFKAIVRAMRPAFASVFALHAPILGALASVSETAADLAAKHIDHEVAAIAPAGSPKVSVDPAAILETTSGALDKRYRTNATATLTGALDAIQQVFARAVADGITVSLLVLRLEMLDPDLRHADALGLGSWIARVRGAVASMARGLLGIARAWVKRLVVTEIIHTYDQQHAAGVEQAQTILPRLLRRWDSAEDMLVCDECDDLNGELAELGEEFEGGYQGPPAHPNCRCRCSVVLSSD